MTPVPDPGTGERFSVIIPAHNAADTIARALDSVLTQGECLGELIVVDDGSTDDTAEIVSSYAGVILVRQPQGGVAVARNSGLERAGFPFVAFLDADDRWLPGKLTAQREVFRAYPDVGLAFTNFANIDEQGGRREGFVQHPGIHRTAKEVVGDILLFDETVFEGLCADLFVAPSTVAVRRELVARVGWFDPGLVTEDLDYWLRLARITRFAGDRRVLAEKYDLSHSLGADQLRMLRGTAEFLAGFPRRFHDLRAGQRLALRKRLGEVQYALGYNARKAGERGQALRLQLQSFRNRPGLDSLVEMAKSLVWR